MPPSLTRVLPLAAVLVLAIAASCAAGDTGAGTLAVPALGVVVTAGLSSKELLEKRAALVQQGRELLDRAEKEQRDLTAEEDAQFAQIHKDADEHKKAADALHSAGERKRQQEDAEREQQELLVIAGLDPAKLYGSAAPQAPPGQRPADETLALAIQGWFINQSSRSDIQLTPEHLRAAQQVGMRLGADELVISLASGRDYQNLRTQILRNDLGVGQGGSKGGYLRPEEFRSSLETAMLHYDVIASLAEVIRTNTGGPMPWPTANDTGNKGEQLGEHKQTNEADPTFALQVWNSYKFSSKAVLVSFELLRDSPFNLATILGDMLGERLGRIKAERFTTGSGNSTCEGLVTGAVLGKTTAAPTAITSDELLDLQYSVDRAYRDNPGAGYMMHDDVILAVRKLKDSNGLPLWEQSIQAGVPDRLHSKPVYANDEMADTIAASAVTALYGDYRKYKIREVGQLRVIRLRERYRVEQDADAFLAFVEADGKLLDAGTHPVKKMVQAAS